MYITWNTGSVVPFLTSGRRCMAWWLVMEGIVSLFLLHQDHILSIVSLWSPWFFLRIHNDSSLLKEAAFEVDMKKSCHLSKLWRHPLIFPLLLWHLDREPESKRMAVRDSASYHPRSERFTALGVSFSWALLVEWRTLALHIGCLFSGQM